MGVTGGEPLGFDVGAKGAGGTLPGLDLVCDKPIVTFHFVRLVSCHLPGMTCRGNLSVANNRGSQGFTCLLRRV